MENRRLLTAAFLSIAVLVVWNIIFPPVPPQEPPTDPAVVEGMAVDPADNADFTEPGEFGGSGEQRSPSVETTSDAGGATPSIAPGGTESSPPVLEAIQGTSQESVVLENELVRAEFTNRGAQMISLRIKGEQNSEGGQIEMVRHRGKDPYPFALVRNGEKLHRLNKVLFQSERTGGATPSAIFRYRGPEGEAEKTFQLGADGLLSSELKLNENGGWGVLLGPGVRNPPEKESKGRFVERGFGYRRGSDDDLLIADKQKEELLLPSTGLDWMALEDNFFFAGFLPDSGIREVIVRPVRQQVELDLQIPRFRVAVDGDDKDLIKEQLVILEASGQEMRFFSLFSSKRYSELVKQPYPFQESVRWGWFGFLAKPLYFGLEWIHTNHVANYGWAIVLITLLIRIAFFPLTWKSQQSMTKMQELGPKMQAIKSKYRNKLKDKQGRPNVDAQRLQNEEMMALYKKEGVNPAGGCLPMLLQMPVFFAFYNVLARAVELRQAEWIGWIHDLSAPDPYFALPVLMTLSSFMMQRIMPSSPDPMQRRLLQFMPIAFGAFALYFPSGLVLYWFTNNLLTMGQQLLLNKWRKRQDQAA